MQTPSMLPSVSARKKETGLLSAVPSTLCVPSALTKAMDCPTAIVISFGVNVKSVRYTVVSASHCACAPKAAIRQNVLNRRKAFIAFDLKGELSIPKECSWEANCDLADVGKLTIQGLAVQVATRKTIRTHGCWTVLAFRCHLTPNLHA